MIDQKRTEAISLVLEAISKVVATGPKDFYTVPETCKLLGICRTTLFYLRKAGKLESCKIGIKKVVITKRSIDKLVFGSDKG